MKVNPITATIDFDADGVQHGHLRVPHSTDRSAWGSILIPVTQIKNGDGPSALLTGANHGDEYEGPIALTKLANTLKAEDVTGRILIVPYMNFPAFEAGTRTSPIDGGNLNRLFPGKPDGLITEKIADFFTRTLLPKADVVVDIHSGGKTLDFVPFAAMHKLGNPDQDAAAEAAMRAFGAPFSMYMKELDPAGLYDTEAESQGKLFVTTELGGGGTATPESVAIGERGVLNVLRHAGILAGEVDHRDTRLLDMTHDNSFIMSTSEGLVEPIKGLGDEVEPGDKVARVWPTKTMGAAPTDYVAGLKGIVAARHFPSRIHMGDCVAVIATVD